MDFYIEKKKRGKKREETYHNMEWRVYKTEEKCNLKTRRSYIDPPRKTRFAKKLHTDLFKKERPSICKECLVDSCQHMINIRIITVKKLSSDKKCYLNMLPKDILKIILKFVEMEVTCVNFDNWYERYNSIMVYPKLEDFLRQGNHSTRICNREKNKRYNRQIIEQNYDMF